MVGIFEKEDIWVIRLSNGALALAKDTYFDNYGEYGLQPVIAQYGLKPILPKPILYVSLKFFGYHFSPLRVF